jgi:hypothetical protein
MSTKPSVPAVPLGGDPTGILGALKENVEQITGRRKGYQPIGLLEDTASTAEIAAKVNEILTRLQGS